MDRTVFRVTTVALLAVFLIPLVLTGCGAPRDVSTPSKAILGHWKNTIPGSATKVYFSETFITYAGKGSEYKVLYTVVKEDLSAFTLFIKLGQPSATATGTEEVTFSADRKTMTLLPEKIPEKLQYTYVDSRQEP
jgi:hypothetical protein